MRRRRGHAFGRAGRAYTPALARERHQEVRRAVLTSRSREAVRQNPALQIAAQLALDVGWCRARLDRIGLPQPRAQPLLARC